MAVLTPSTPSRLLVVNAGSSSLKLRLLDRDDTLVASADLPPLDQIQSKSLAAEIAMIADTSPGAIGAVGHRVVHGGVRFSGAVRITAAVRAALSELTDLAPLHQPKSLAALDAVTSELPDVPAVACFDTAFHHSMPQSASTYPVPAQWRERYGVRRYGFHGLSHAYCAHRCAELLGREPDGLRIISCHLGAGASLTAIVGGQSVDTTMGFTPLDGLVMATRSGSLDPGLLLWLQEHEHLPTQELASALEHRSGLLALTGTSDMRVVEQRARSGDPDARLAFDVFTHRLVTSIGAMTAAAGGIDVLAFTGGIGEGSSAVRDHAARRLAHLGVEVDSNRNEAAVTDCDVSTSAARVRTLVIGAREDLQIARETRRVLG